MKVAPNNQTLILAGEREHRVPPRAALGSALPDDSGGSVLKTVTIVTALPDTTLVYMRADYSPRGDAPSARSVATPPRAASIYSPSDEARSRPPGALRDAYGNLRVQSRHVELYARTQLLLANTPPMAHIDVHA